LAKYSGEINHNEPHVVKWVPMEVLINGSFGRYNQMVSESLLSMGIDFELDIDIITLTDEVDEYLQNNKLLGMTFKLDEIRKELNYFDRGVYMVYFDIDYDEFLWDIDNEFIDGLEAIGQKYCVKLKIPYYYYSK
jgi:hypothetical protein